MHTAEDPGNRAGRNGARLLTWPPLESVRAVTESPRRQTVPNTSCHRRRGVGGGGRVGGEGSGR